MFNSSGNKIMITKLNIFMNFALDSSISLRAFIQGCFDLYSSSEHPSTCNGKVQGKT